MQCNEDYECGDLHRECWKSQRFNELKKEKIMGGRALKTDTLIQVGKRQER